MTEQRKNKQRLGFLGSNPTHVNHHLPSHWASTDDGNSSVYVRLDAEWETDRWPCWMDLKFCTNMVCDQQDQRHLYGTNDRTIQGTATWTFQEASLFETELHFGFFKGNLIMLKFFLRKYIFSIYRWSLLFMYSGSSHICLLHRQALLPIAVQRICIFPSFKAKLWDCSVLENNNLSYNWPYWWSC